MTTPEPPADQSVKARRRTWRPKIRQRQWFPGWHVRLSLPGEWAWPRRAARKPREPDGRDGEADR